MICPRCEKNDTKVLDSRETDGQKVIRRRRECDACKHRFTTFERLETTNFVVVKRDGTRENYHRDKLLNGVWKACEKRKVTEKQISQLTSELEDKWSRSGKEIESKTIGEDMMELLRKFDEVAYIRFASVYKDFKDIESFKKELNKLEKL